MRTSCAAPRRAACSRTGASANGWRVDFLTQRQSCTLDHTLQKERRRHDDLDLDLDLDRHGAGRRYGADRRRFRWLRNAGDLPQRTVRNQGLLAAGIAELGPDWRHITYDERARGARPVAQQIIRSRPPSAMSVLCSMLKVSTERWWSGGRTAPSSPALWASRNPDRTIGAVMVDGAQPHDWLTDEMEQGIRTVFRRLQWLMVPLRVTGLTPRMTAREMADCNIEIGRLARERELGPVMDRITVPTRYVLASGTSFGSTGDGQEKIGQASGCRTQPAHHHPRQGREQSRRDPPQGLPRDRPRRYAASLVEAVWSPCSRSANWPPTPG